MPEIGPDGTVPSGGSGGSTSGSGELGIRITARPDGPFGERFLIDGFEVPASLSGDQSGGQDIPEQPLEGGYNVHGRNVLNPESGTLKGAVTLYELYSLRRSYRQTEPIIITGPEGTITDCFVESIDRTHEGGYYNKVEIEINWQQAFLAELGTVSIQAVTKDAKHTPQAGSDGDNGGQTSLVGSESGGGPASASNQGPGTNGSGGGPVAQVGNAVSAGGQSSAYGPVEGTVVSAIGDAIAGFGTGIDLGNGNDSSQQNATNQTSESPS